MSLLKDILWTIGGPEAPVGTPVARTAVLPVTDHPGFDQRVAHMQDSVIAGGRMGVRTYPVKWNVGGPFPLRPAVGPGFGKPLKSLFGLESAPAQIGAVMKIRYTGASASCKLVADTAGNTLKSYIGALGAEGADAAFGVAGSLDLTLAGNDTVAEIVAIIEAYADYECRLVNGAGTVASADIVSVTTQAKGKWTYFFFTLASGVYLRTFTADLTNTQHPVYSVEREGYQDQMLYSAVQFSGLKFSTAAGGMASASMEALGFVETPGAPASGLTIANLDAGAPLIFGDGSTELAGVDYADISTIDLSIDNGHNAETYGQGSLGRLYHEKGELKIVGTLQVRLSAASYALRGNLLTSTLVGCTLMFKGKLLSASLYEMLIAELAFCQISPPFDFVPVNGAFAAKVNIEDFNPGGIKWDVPIKVHEISSVAAAY